MSLHPNTIKRLASLALESGGLQSVHVSVPSPLRCSPRPRNLGHQQLQTLSKGADRRHISEPGMSAGVEAEADP